MQKTRREYDNRQQVAQDWPDRSQINKALVEILNELTRTKPENPYLFIAEGFRIVNEHGLSFFCALMTLKRDPKEKMESERFEAVVTSFCQLTDCNYIDTAELRKDVFLSLLKELISTIPAGEQLYCLLVTKFNLKEDKDFILFKDYAEIVKMMLLVKEFALCIHEYNRRFGMTKSISRFISDSFKQAPSVIKVTREHLTQLSLEDRSEQTKSAERTTKAQTSTSLTEETIILSVKSLLQM